LKGCCRRRSGAGAKRAEQRGAAIICPRSAGQEFEINIARPASSAAATVPMKAACTNGTDLRKALRIHCPRFADC
jgi:hypothetical protein